MVLHSLIEVDGRNSRWRTKQKHTEWRFKGWKGRRDNVQGILEEREGSMKGEWWNSKGVNL